MRVLLLKVALWASIAAQADEPSECEVTLRVVNVEGSAQSYQVTSFRNNRDIEFASRFSGLRGRVPCSKTSSYTFEVSWNLAQTARVAEVTRIGGTILAEHPENWRTVSTSPSAQVQADGSGAGFVNWGNLPDYVFRGRIKPTPSEPLWVQFRSAVRTGRSASSEMEAAVDENGEFRVYDAFYRKAPYLLYIMNQSGTIVHVELVKPESRNPFTPFEVTIPPFQPEIRVIGQ